MAQLGRWSATSLRVSFKSNLNLVQAKGIIYGPLGRHSSEGKG